MFGPARDPLCSSGCVMRRVGRVAQVCLLLSVAITGAPSKASAQSFLEGLFGIFSSNKKPQSQPPAAPAVTTRVLPPPGGYSRGYYSGFEEGDDYDTWERRGAYRAVCVRLCDGYYWPISNSVSGGSLHRAARHCATSCDGEARLFYQLSSSSEPDTLVDLAGRRYRDLPNALLYRKRLIDGCTCKPMPWTEAEAARHRGYAADQAEALVLAGAGKGPDARPSAEVIAGGEADVDPAADAAAESSAATRQPVDNAENVPAAAVIRAPAPVPVAASPAVRSRRGQVRPAAAGYSRAKVAPAQAKFTWPGDAGGQY